MSEEVNSELWKSENFADFGTKEEKAFGGLALLIE